MSYKRIITSVAVIVAVGVAVAGATGAFYSDTETSENNIFTAGSIDLKVDHLKQTYNGVDCETCSLTLYSADGNTEVVDGENAELTDFPFDAPEVDDPHESWATHATATWVWASEETEVGDDGSDEDDTSYTFERTFDWNGDASGVDFQLDVGADNTYEVFLNGTSVATGAGYDDIDENTIANSLQNGENTLQIVVTNEYNDQFPGSNDPENNPGGLLYYLDIDREDCEEGVNGFQDQCQLWEEKDLEGDETFFHFGDIKPGDWGSNIISLHVDDNDAYSCLLAHDGDDQENGVMESEGNDDSENGELQNYIEFFAWVDHNEDNEYNGSDTSLGTSTLGDLGSIASMEGDNFLTATSTEYIGLEWCAGDISEDDGQISCDGAGMLNDAQSDSFSSSLTAFAEQTRNNDNFSCEDVDLDEEE